MTLLTNKLTLEERLCKLFKVRKCAPSVLFTAMNKAGRMQVDIKTQQILLTIIEELVDLNERLSTPKK